MLRYWLSDYITLSGHPLPILAWTREGVTLNTTFSVLSQPGSLQSTVSVLRVREVAREDDGAVYQCLAHSQASHTPLVQQVTMDLICKFTLHLYSSYEKLQSWSTPIYVFFGLYFSYKPLDSQDSLFVIAKPVSSHLEPNGMVVRF